MLIAIDYDNTFTAAPGLWCALIGMCNTMGDIQVICVTRRSPADPIEDPRLTIPVVYAHDEFKRVAAERAGYKVDIWIDDTPGVIEPSRILTFEEGA